MPQFRVYFRNTQKFAAFWCFILLVKLLQLVVHCLLTTSIVDSLSYNLGHRGPKAFGSKTEGSTFKLRIFHWKMIRHNYMHCGIKNAISSSCNGLGNLSPWTRVLSPFTQFLDERIELVKNLINAKLFLQLESIGMFSSSAPTSSSGTLLPTTLGSSGTTFEASDVPAITRGGVAKSVNIQLGPRRELKINQHEKKSHKTSENKRKKPTWSVTNLKGNVNTNVDADLEARKEELVHQARFWGLYCHHYDLHLNNSLKCDCRPVSWNEVCIIIP